MLFAIKNHFAPTLLLAALFAATSLAARELLGLTWKAAPLPELSAYVAVGLTVILASDALVHGVLLLALRERYQERYRALVAYFRPQGAREILASGVLAAGEEMLFRGVVLTALLQRGEWSASIAVAVTALLFGALHVMRDSKLAPFGIWAVWEGTLLGALYVVTGGSGPSASIAALMLIHAAHDVGGFALMAWLRRPGQRPATR